VTNVILDLIGGLASISQLIVDAIATDHIEGILYASSKMAIGIVSVFFDTIFCFQHYVWFSKPTSVELVISGV
jgi:cystinosin